MPLEPSPPSAVLCRSFYSLVIGKTLEILLEKPREVDLETLNRFLKNPKKDVLEFDKNIKIDLENKQIYVRGYELDGCEGWTILSCNSSTARYKIPIDFDEKILITTLEYFYHMMSSL
jgi:hypothetical protein